jgi:hypothetical protein
MKLKRDEFKAMLKECILELVQEGKIFQGTNLSAHRKPVAEHAALDADIVESGTVTPNTRLNEAVKMTAAGMAKGDPKRASMFESIIADTARTTLQKQLSAEMTGGSGGLMGMGAPALPEERAFDQAQMGMFAAKDRWATLAFGGKPKNGNGQ